MNELSPIHVAPWLAAAAVVVFLYSSVGYGAATGYLAVMALPGVTPTFARPAGLRINCAFAFIAPSLSHRVGFFAGRVLNPLALASGRALGFLAGLTGIGGGVLLTARLWFVRWTLVTTADGISALSVVVKSVSGLIGLGKQAIIAQPVFLAGPVIGTAGWLGGTQIGVRRWNAVTFRRLLAAGLWIAALRLLLTGR